MFFCVWPPAPKTRLLELNFPDSKAGWFSHVKCAGGELLDLAVPGPCHAMRRRSLRRESHKMVIHKKRRRLVKLTDSRK